MAFQIRGLVLSVTELNATVLTESGQKLIIETSESLPTPGTLISLSRNCAAVPLHDYSVLPAVLTRIDSESYRFSAGNLRWTLSKVRFAQNQPPLQAKTLLYLIDNTAIFGQLYPDPYEVPAYSLAAFTQSQKLPLAWLKDIEIFDETFDKAIDRLSEQYPVCLRFGNSPWNYFQGILYAVIELHSRVNLADTGLDTLIGRFPSSFLAVLLQGLKLERQTLDFCMEVVYREFYKLPSSLYKGLAQHLLGTRKDYTVVDILNSLSQYFEVSICVIDQCENCTHWFTRETDQWIRCIRTRNALYLLYTNIELLLDGFDLPSLTFKRNTPRKQLTKWNSSDLALTKFIQTMTISEKLQRIQRLVNQPRTVQSTCKSDKEQTINRKFYLDESNIICVCCQEYKLIKLKMIPCLHIVCKDCANTQPNGCAACLSTTDFHSRSSQQFCFQCKKPASYFSAYSCYNRHITCQSCLSLKKPCCVKFFNHAK